jgi:hypothetical protein
MSCRQQPPMVGTAKAKRLRPVDTGARRGYTQERASTRQGSHAQIKGAAQPPDVRVSACSWPGTWVSGKRVGTGDASARQPEPAEVNPLGYSERGGMGMSQYQALHQALVKTMDNDKRLMARAKTLNTQLQVRRSQSGLGVRA